MRIILELKTDCLKKDDIVYYDGKSWVNKSKRAYLLDTQRQIDDLQKESEALKAQFEALKASVNEKLKQYHDILKLSVENEGE